MGEKPITRIPDPITSIENVIKELNEPNNECIENYPLNYMNYNPYPVNYGEYYNQQFFGNQIPRIEKRPILLPSIKDAFSIEEPKIVHAHKKERLSVNMNTTKKDGNEKKPKKSNIENSRNRNKQYLRELSEQSLQFSTNQSSESNENPPDESKRDNKENELSKENDSVRENGVKYDMLRTWLNKNALSKRKLLDNTSKEKESVENMINRSTTLSLVEQSPQQPIPNEKSKSEQIKIQIPQKESSIKRDELTKKIIELRNMVVSDLHMIYSKSKNETEKIALWRLITDINNLRYGQSVVINQKNRGCYTQTVREIDKKMDLILNLLKDYPN